jgi:vacuolar-type H+-ATPase subunit D/Vma8
MKKLDNFKNEFKSANIMSPTLKLESDKVAGKIEAEMRGFTKIDERIDTKLYDIVSKFKTNYYDKYH